MNLRSIPLNARLLVNFLPLFVSFSSFASSKRRQNFLNWQKIASKSGHFGYLPQVLKKRPSQPLFFNNTELRR
jgi:hypothetical protein